MDILLMILILLASVLLVLVVFVQNPKGGGLSTDFGAPHQLGGVQKTNDFIEKSTWGLAAAIGVLSIVLSIMHKQTFTPIEDVAADVENTEGTPTAPATGNEAQQ